MHFLTVRSALRSVRIRSHPSDNFQQKTPPVDSPLLLCSTRAPLSLASETDPPPLHLPFSNRSHPPSLAQQPIPLHRRPRQGAPSSQPQPPSTRRPPATPPSAGAVAATQQEASPSPASSHRRRLPPGAPFHSTSPASSHSTRLPVK